MKRKLSLVLVAVLVLLCGTVFASADSDPAVTIVSPGQTVYGSTLLVSVKITEPKTVRVSVWEQKAVVGDTLVPIITDEQGNYTAETVKSVAVMEAETFTCPDNLRFYSKELSNLTPGLYKITVETLKDGNVTAST